MLSSYLLGDPEVFPGQIRYVIPPASSGSTPVSPPIGRTQKTSKGSHPGGILRCPNHLSWLLWTQRISGFTWPACIHNLILSITTQTHEHRWGLECRSIWKSIKLCLLVQHPFFFYYNSLVQHPYYCWWCTDPPVDLMPHFIITRSEM